MTWYTSASSSVHINETLTLYFLYIFCIFFLQANLRRLDFTGNLIEDIEDGTFSKLSLLEELTLAENQLLKLPVLPPKLTLFNAKYNKIKSRGIKANTFKVSFVYCDHTQYQFYTTNGNMIEKLWSKILFYILKLFLQVPENTVPKVNAQFYFYHLKVLAHKIL